MKKRAGYLPRLSRILFFSYSIEQYGAYFFGNLGRLCWISCFLAQAADMLIGSVSVRGTELNQACFRFSS